MSKRKPSAILGLFFFLLSGCCGKYSVVGSGCSSYCPCVKPDDVFHPAKLELVNALNNITNTTIVMKNDSINNDTLSFGGIMKDEKVYRSSRCLQPKQTCCSDDRYENYTVSFFSVRGRGSYSLISSEGGINNTLGSDVIYNGSLTSIIFSNKVIEDAIVNVDASFDTVSIFSISKGLILYTDFKNMKWKRVL